MITAEELKHIADLRRADALTMIFRARTGHTGGAMSCLDIMTVLYYAVLREQDLFLLSKGHSVEGLYAILADMGHFPKEELRTFSQPGSRLIGHPTRKVNGIAVNTGSLGHGLPVGVGAALAAKRQGIDKRVYVLMGDGEQAEGSVWEAAMSGSNFHLDNLCAIVDRNGLQISGQTECVMALENFADKWRAFGWDVSETDGHDHGALVTYFRSEGIAGKPRMLIARTIKGQGLPCACGKPEWHHKVPTQEQLTEAYAALGVKGVSWA